MLCLGRGNAVNRNSDVLASRWVPLQCGRPVNLRVRRIPALAPRRLGFVQGVASPLVRRCSPLSLVVLHRPEPRRCSANGAGCVVIDSTNVQRLPVGPSF